MKTKKRLAALRFSKRLRIRESIEYEKIAHEYVDTRKSPDQFQQNEFLKLFDLESTNSSTEQSQGQQTNVGIDSNSNASSSTSPCRLAEVFLGFSPPPVVSQKRKRRGRPKAFDLKTFDDMSTHLPSSVTVSFGKQSSIDQHTCHHISSLCVLIFFADKQLYELDRMNHILKQKNQDLQDKRTGMMKEEIYRESLLNEHKHTNRQLKDALQALQQQLQTLIS